MPDWREWVRQRLGRVRLPLDEREEVVREFAGYLEDLDEEQHRQGLSGEQVVRRTEAEVEDWNKLATEVAVLRRQTMNKRVKAMWLPGFTIFFLAVWAEYLLEGAGLQASVAWPGADFSVRLMHPAALLTAALLGAGGGAWSRWMGGGRWLRLQTGLLPGQILLFVFLFLFLPFRLMDPDTSFSGMLFAELAATLVGMVLIPGAAILLGALPFFFIESTEPDLPKTA